MITETSQAFDCAGQLDAELIFGSTPGMREVRATLEQALRDDLPVLIEGESGTGKEVIARFLHCHSARREKPFVKLNCGSVPARLLEGVMFAFEGNGSGGVGMLEHSLLGNPHDGTLFLDEVVDLDLSLRHKLTQALQVCRDRLPGEEKPFRPRFVCATSANLAAGVQQDPTLDEFLGRFPHRARLLPLRERKRDISQLCGYLGEKSARTFGRPVPHLTESVLDAFSQWNWPGNIRELENWIARIVIFGTEEVMSQKFSSLSGSRAGESARRHRATQIDFSHVRRTRRNR